MPSTLPIPSKGALRTLRNLALGTSCTVAFTTGVLTEDRRRRIHSVQKVHDNAKKIKSSRHYHGSGASEAIEAQIMRNTDEGFWQTGRPLSAAVASAETTDGQFIGRADEILGQAGAPPSAIEPGKYVNVPAGSSLPRAPKFPSGHMPSKRYRAPSAVQAAPELPTARSSSLLEPRRQSESGTTTLPDSRQHKLASDILNLVQDESAPAAVDAAVSRFFDAFQDDPPVDESGIGKELMDAAARLSNACLAQTSFDAAEKILQIMLGHGKIDLEVFLSFDPEAIMNGLISEEPNEDSHSTALYKAKLRKACSLYLTNFKTKPKAIPETMVSLGKRLCELACRYELFDLVEGLYWRVERYNEGTPLALVKPLIVAAHSRKQHAKVLKYFKRFYIQTSPSQLEFYTVLGLVMKSVFGSDRHRVSEDILMSATRIAQREGLSMSTTSFLMVLGHDWRSHRNIGRTRELFDRLQPHLHLSRHPQAAYGAIIQFCVEANDEPAATRYYEQLREFHNLGATDVRIHGHFTLARAMRNDWSGVKDNLSNMKQMDPDVREFSASFTPILRIFAQSHKVNETEDFLRLFIHQYGGLLTPCLSNIMIDEYMKAGELDSVSRWLDYMASVNCQVDPSFFNLILRDCSYKFKLSYKEVCQVYQSVAKLDSRASRFVNTDTLSTLREIAISSSGKNVAKGVQNLQFLKLHVPIKRTNCGREIREAMTVALAKGDPSRALKIYRRALNNQVILSESTVTLAVRAAIELHPENIDAAVCLLQDSQQNGQSVKYALSSMFVHLISELNSDGKATSDAIKNLAQSAISSLESRGISMATYVTTHTMSILVKRRQFQEAIDFWNSMSRREGHPPMMLDLYTLTTLLRAYLGLRDPRGVEWAVKTLSTNNITPDRRFQQTLLKACREAEKFIAPYFTHSIVKALDTVYQLRGDGTREKDIAKMKVLKIMESAILTEGKDHPEISDPLEDRTDTLKISLPEFNIAESTEASVYPAEKPVLDVGTVPQPSLVGVAAG